MFKRTDAMRVYQVVFHIVVSATATATAPTAVICVEDGEKFPPELEPHMNPKMSHVTQSRFWRYP